MYLSTINSHPRDANITFEEEGHKYTILTDPTSKYTSVTTWCHSHFPKFDADKVITGIMRSKNWKEGHKYWGMTSEEIKSQWSTNGASVSQSGTDLHYRIECFMNNRLPEDPEIPFSGFPLSVMDHVFTHRELLEQPIAIDDFQVQEWTYFLNFVRDHPLMKPYRTEWTIYNEDIKISGSIDMVYENEDGTLSIYDWKRCKQITKVNQFNKYALTPEICEMPDSNFWHYSLQLNTYKAILESKYNKTIRDMFLVQLHPESDEGNYVLYKVPDLSIKIQEMFQKYCKDT
jgi:hypothetical protein